MSAEMPPNMLAQGVVMDAKCFWLAGAAIKLLEAGLERNPPFVKANNAFGCSEAPSVLFKNAWKAST